jgi:hypothetical protein
MNSMAKSVFPLPAAPHISVGRPLGKPPSVISSRPAIPEGVLGKVFFNVVLLFETDAISYNCHLSYQRISIRLEMLKRHKKILCQIWSFTYRSIE